MVSRPIWGLALLCAALGAHAQDSRAKSALERFLADEVLDRIESNEGAAKVTIGKHFFTGNSSAQQDVIRVAYEYVHSEDPAINALTILDSAGRVVGSYSEGRLTLSGQ